LSLIVGVGSQLCHQILTADKGIGIASASPAMELIIFDCDGVLVDSEIIAHQLLAQMMTDLGHPMTTAESVQKFAGRSLADILRRIEAILGRSISDDLGQHYGSLLLERLRRDLKPIAGVKEAIAALRCPCCVASSSSLERIRLSLEVTELAPLFGSNIFSATQVAHGKPAPDLYLFAATRMAVAPDDCVVIEDSTLGVTAGRAAGMRVIGFTGGAHAIGDAARYLAAAGAYPIVSSMAELPATVEGVMSCVESPCQPR
jgi:HAD superfamily hydrolase (TIGR01509 family)